MTREEAIEILKGYMHYAVGIGQNGESHTNAFDMAIEALSIVRCKDCRWYKVGKNEVDSWQLCGHPFREYENVTDDDFCSWGEMGDINP